MLLCVPGYWLVVCIALIIFCLIRLFNILKFSGKELSEGPKYVAIAGEQSSVVGWWLFLIRYLLFWVHRMEFTEN